MRTTRLAQLVTTSMLISAMSFGTVEATYNSGTIDNVGGTIVLGNYYYTYATDNLTLNVTSDLILTNPVNQGRVFGFGGANQNIVFNMNNNTFSSTNIYGGYERKSNVGVYINNAKDIYMFRPDGNIINIVGDQDVVYMQANHDITFDMGTNVTNNPPLIIGAKMVETMIAGNNFNIIAFSNPINLAGGELDITAGQDINILSSGTSGGIWTGNKGTILNMTAQNGKIDVLSTGGNTASLIIDSGTTGTLLANKDITIGGNSNRGIRANGGTVNLTSTTGKIKVSATNTTSKSGSTPINAGIYAGTNTQRGIANLNSDTEVSAVLRGVHADNGTVNFAKNVTITEAQKGIVAENAGEVNVAGNAVITSTDTNVAVNNSKVTFAQDVNMTGAQKGIVADNSGDVNIAGNAVITSTDTNVAADNSKVIFAQDVNMTGAQKGIVAENTGEVNVAGNAVITSTDTSVAADNGTVTFAQNLTLSGAPTAIAVANGGVVTDTNRAAAKMITGNITSDGAGSLVDTNFATADSYFTGTTTVSNTGAINLDFAGGAPWNVTGDSSLTSLVNNSTVNMRYTGRSTNEAITVDNLSGNGTYIINTDLQGSYDSKDVRQNGDKLIITASSSGSNILDLRDVSLYKKLASQGYLLLVEDQSRGSATFTGKDLAHGGIFRYKPVITTDNPTDYTNYNPTAKNWYLTGFERTIEVSDNTNVTLGLAETRYGSYFTDNDTLLKRLGELRMLKSQIENDGLWAKVRHGTMEGKKFDGNFTTVQVGYDKKTSAKRYTGAAFSHTDNNFSLGAGNGEGSMDALTLYNTWLGEKNHYFDIVGKVGKMRGNSSYYDSLFPEKGEFDNWFYSLGGEYGRKNIAANGWYYEPQVQLTLGRINSSDYTTSLGTRVHMGAINSVLGRAGVTVGREYNRDNPAKHGNVYGKVNVLHEFRGDVTTGLLDSYGDGYSPTAEYGGSWLNAGVGATVNLDKNTHLYFDLEKNFHGAVTSKWIGQLGCRWTW